MSLPPRHRPSVLATLVGLGVLPLASGQDSRQDAYVRPNIVLIVADDLGYGDVGFNGAQDVATPRIDRMASEGLRSSAFYTAVSCTPTRAALMTGAYAARVDVRSPFGAWSDFGLAPSEYTVAEMLRDAGYRTGIFGKWHLGDSPDQLPTGQGFDEMLVSAWGLPARPHLLLDTSGLVETDSDPVPWTPLFVDRTLAFLDASVLAGGPFFCVLSHTSPHLPATPSPDFVGVSADGREYGDAVEEIDASVGAVLDRLDALGVGDDTLVMFFSDNGPALGMGAYQAGSAGGLRGGKGSTFEGGVRSPFVARWPARIAGGATSDAPIHVVDAFDTLAALARATLPAGLPVRDGADVSDVLLGGPGNPQRVVHHFRRDVLEGVRRGHWKWRLGELYDLASDPAETLDLAFLFPSTAQSLESLRAAKEAEVLANVRPRAVTERRSPQWRANAGLAGGVVHGAEWHDRLQRSEPWRVVDADPLASFTLVPTAASPGDQLPTEAVRLDAYAPAVVLERDGSDLGVEAATDPFSLELWARSLSDDPASESILFEAGDALLGVSFTVGDAGLAGDDLAPGRRDDLLVRVGGALAPTSVSLLADLPSGPGGWSDTFVHLVLTHDGDEAFTLWINGIAASSAVGPNLFPGLRSRWTLFGVSGGLGASSGLGPLPFPGSSFEGEIAAFRAFDRELARKEVEIALCRHVAYSYCAPLPDASGSRVRFDLVGDFRADSRDVRVEVTGVPPGTLGRVLFSRDQAREPAFGGYLCVDRFLQAPSTPVVVSTGQPGVRGSDFLPLGTLPFDPLAGSSWNFQLWLDAPPGQRFSNALHVLFCP